MRSCVLCPSSDLRHPPRAPTRGPRCTLWVKSGTGEPLPLPRVCHQSAKCPRAHNIRSHPSKLRPRGSRGKVQLGAHLYTSRRDVEATSGWETLPSDLNADRPRALPSKGRDSRHSLGRAPAALRLRIGGSPDSCAVFKYRRKA